MEWCHEKKLSEVSAPVFKTTGFLPWPWAEIVIKPSQVVKVLRGADRQEGQLTSWIYKDRTME